MGASLMEKSMTPEQGASAIVWAALDEATKDALIARVKAHRSDPAIPDDIERIGALRRYYEDRGSRGVYGSVCAVCGHVSSSHRWHPEAGGDLRNGPYVCSECACEQPQAGPFVPLNRKEFERWKASSESAVSGADETPDDGSIGPDS